MSTNTRTTLARVMVTVLAAACAACSSSGKPALSGTPTVSTSAASGPFPSTAAAPLPAGTVHIKINGTFSMSGPLFMSADDHYVWTEGLVRIDPETNQATNLAKGTRADFVASGAGSIWASDFNGNVVRRYDPSGRLLATVPVLDGPEGLALAAGAMWVASHHGGTVDRIDTRTNRVSDRIKVTDPGSGGPQVVTAGLGGVWTGISAAQAVAKIDPSARRTTLHVDMSSIGGDPCGGIALTPTAGWASSCFDGTQLDEFDPSTGKILKSKDIGANVSQIVADGDTVWFVASGSSVVPSTGKIVLACVLVQLDPHWNVLHRYALGSSFATGGIVKAFGSIWVGNSAMPEVLRIPLPAH